MGSLPQQVSESTRRRNPALYGNPLRELETERAVREAKTRLRQPKEPEMNGLETEWFENLKSDPLISNLRGQSLRFRLARGAWYKPDVTCDILEKGDKFQRTAYECKGPKEMKGMAKSMLTLKVVASEWPEWKFFLVWKDREGQWQKQEVLS